MSDTIEISKFDLKDKKKVEELFKELTGYADEQARRFSLNEKRLMVRELLLPAL